MPLDICEGAQHIAARPEPTLRTWPPSARLAAYGDLASIRGHAMVRTHGRTRSNTRSIRVGEALLAMSAIELERERA